MKNSIPDTTMTNGIQKADRVKAITGHFAGKSGYVTRTNGSSACVVWKGVWDHGIWVSISDLKLTKRPKTNLAGFKFKDSDSAEIFWMEGEE